MTDAECGALVGAVGGAGTTRTAVELAATLARDGRRVAVLDAALATQGLADYVEGRIDPDLTRLVTGGEGSARTGTDGTADVRPAATLDEALVHFNADVPGEVACVPVRAPFERLARAQTTEAARAFESLVGEARERFDHVLIDTPPVASNLAIAAVSAADRVVVVAPAGPRGEGAVPRMRDRLADLGVDAHAVVSTRGELPGADATVPDLGDDAAPTAAPVTPTDDALAGSFLGVAAGTLRCSLDLDLEGGGVVDRVRRRVERDG
jgi:cellulose biosynthesis protein BcsQ